MRLGVALRLVMLAATAVPAGPALAGTIPTNLQPSIRYPVSGTISPACALAQSSTGAEVVALTNSTDNTPRSRDVSLPFNVECNSPVRVSMTSTHGGLRFAGQATSDPAFTQMVRYQATVILPGPGKALSCASQAMDIAAPDCSAHTEKPVGKGTGHILVRTQAADALLQAGKYRDRVTLTITPFLGGEVG